MNTSITNDWQITFGPYTYPMYLRSGGWAELRTRSASLEADKFVLIADEGVPDNLISKTHQALSASSPVSIIIIPVAEKSKTLETIDSIASQLLSEGHTRRSVFVALGGGLAGNVAGLLAHLFLRGARLVHIPTTLLAMSDSVLSLKQAVNSAVGKNHLGAFHAPELVWCDLEFTETLPSREIQAALCEMAKNILTVVPGRYNWALAHLRPRADYSPTEIAEFITLCVTAKSLIMRTDPYEKGPALILEYGHTTGHAIELLSHGEIPHGHAIGLGMLVAAQVSASLGYLPKTHITSHRTLLEQVGISLTLPHHILTSDIMDIVVRDNKRGYLPPREGMADMVLLSDLGKPVRTGNSLITQVPLSVLNDSIDKVLRP